MARPRIEQYSLPSGPFKVLPYCPSRRANPGTDIHTTRADRAASFDTSRQIRVLVCRFVPEKRVSALSCNHYLTTRECIVKFYNRTTEARTVNFQALIPAAGRR